MKKRFPVIDPGATGENIARLRRARGLSVRDVQQWFGFEEPQAVYKWQQGKTLPSVDNLYALCSLLEVSVEELLVTKEEEKEQQDEEPAALWLFRGIRGVIFSRKQPGTSYPTGGDLSLNCWFNLYGRKSQRFLGRCS